MQTGYAWLKRAIAKGLIPGVDNIAGFKAFYNLVSKRIPKSTPVPLDPETACIQKVGALRGDGVPFV